MTVSRDNIERVFREHYSSLVSYAKLMLPAEEAEDVVQDVFAWVWDHRFRLPYLNDERELRLYLLNSVWHGCLNKLRRRKNDSAHRIWFKDRIEQQYSAYDPDNDPVIRKLYTEDIQEQVSSLLSELPDRCREVFVLSRLEGIPNRRVAQILGLSLSTVENHIYNAMKHLRERVQKK